MAAIVPRAGHIVALWFSNVLDNHWAIMGSSSFVSVEKLNSQQHDCRKVYVVLYVNSEMDACRS